MSATETPGSRTTGPATTVARPSRARPIGILVAVVLALGGAGLGAGVALAAVGDDGPGTPIGRDHLIPGQQLQDGRGALDGHRRAP